MRDSLYVAEARIAGAGERLVVSCSNIGDHNMPVFLVDPKYYDDFLDACEGMSIAARFRLLRPLATVHELLLGSDLTAHGCESSISKGRSI